MRSLSKNEFEQSLYSTGVHIQQSRYDLKQFYRIMTSSTHYDKKNDHSFLFFFICVRVLHKWFNLQREKLDMKKGLNRKIEELQIKTTQFDLWNHSTFSDKLHWLWLVKFWWIFYLFVMIWLFFVAFENRPAWTRKNEHIRFYGFQEIKFKFN